MQAFFYVFLGGGLGSLCRYGISRFIQTNDWHFPTATFTANVISCLILGCFIGMALKDGMNASQRLLWVTGFCGGFSTFSTFSGETFQLLQDGHTTTAFAYVLGSLVVCILCIGLGVFLSQKLL